MAENYTYGKYVAGLIGFGASFYWMLQGAPAIRIIIMLFITGLAIFATAYKENQLKKRNKQ